MRVDIQISVLSKQGDRARNEDACGYWGTDGAGPICCVLSDGAGGHGGGDVAARIAVDAVLTEFSQHPESSPARVNELIELANAAVIREQQLQPAIASMRATLVLATFDPKNRQVCWGHIGDSRLYFFRGGEVVARTKDHSLIQTMIDAGYVKAEEGARRPESSVLVASLGSMEGFTPDVVDGAYAAQTGDAWLLCSDGLWEHFSDAQVARMLHESSTPNDWLARLDSAVLSAKQNGQDNFSALAVWCRNGVRA